MWVLGRASPLLRKGQEEGRLRCVALFASEQERQPGSFWLCLSSVCRGAVSSLSPRPTFISLPSERAGSPHWEGHQGADAPFCFCAWSKDALTLLWIPPTSVSRSLWGSLILSVLHLRNTDRICVETYIFRLTNRYFLTNTSPKSFPLIDAFLAAANYRSWGSPSSQLFLHRLALKSEALWASENSSCRL